MIKGIFYAMGACALWGLVFVIPVVLTQYSPFEIAIGRCVAFGFFSIGMLLIQRQAILAITSFPVIRQALWLSLVVNILHYICLVFGLQFGNEAITTVILGVNPIVIACYSNFLRKEIDFLSLAIPCTLTLFGILVLYSPLLSQMSLIDHLFGLMCALLALGTWSWFIVQNANFLKENPAIQAHHWVTIMGITTLFWALPLTPTLSALPPPDFLFGCAVLGVGSSWVAHYLWNRATQQVSLVLAGQLSVLETLFGLLYIYILKMQLPTPIEILGIAIILTSVLLAIRNRPPILNPG